LLTFKLKITPTLQYIIVRRGGEMAFQVVLDGPLDEGQSLSLYIAPASIFLPSTLRITHLGGTQYEVSSQVDPNAPTGLCSISVRLSDMNDLYSLPRQVAVLFNPWHPQDSTFYPATDELVEYINNEQGITYRGTNVNVQSVRWYYAQFSPEAILAALHQVNKLGIDERRDPNAVIRFFTAAMTPQPSNPDGILVGRWDRTYPGGMNPSAWQGSDQVLRHYVATGFNSVKYGQCWVFAGVLNTLGRVMGIPTRQISNFDSAHETPVAPGVYNQEILRYWDRNSRRMVAEVGMIWNFHSWNEVWHDNRVAGSPYTGAQWNVVDGTPQELSGDRYQLGPASVRAVRDSQKLPFDTSFVLSEVSSRIHNFAVACPFIPWGKLNQLPPQCTIIRDMGREARYPTGTIVVTKLPGLQNFGPNTITGTYHGRGGPAANAGPVFSSGVPTPGLPTGMRARPGAPGASRFRRFSVTDGDDDDDSTEADADTEGSSGSVAGRTSRNSYAATGTGAVGRALDAEWNSLLFNYDESGLAISVTIPPVRLGEPIKLWVNFACAGRTEDFLASMRSRDRARGFITLADGDDNEDDSSADDTSAGDEDNGSDVSGVQCPDELDVSVHVDVTFTDYTGQERGRIGEHRLDLTLHPKNGYFESFEFEAADYLSGARASRTGAADEYVRVTAMAVDSSTVPGESITLVAVNTMALTMPRLTLHGNQTVLRTEQRRDKVTVDVEADDGTLVRAVVVETLSGPGTGVGAGLSGTLEREVDVMSVEVSPTGSLSFSTLAADVDADADSVATDARAGANAATLATAAAAADRAAVTDALLALADAAATADPLAAADPGVEVTVMFRNELGIALTGVVLRLSADDMGFDERVVELQSGPCFFFFVICVLSDF
jgi:hypothetical protein